MLAVKRFKKLNLSKHEVFSKTSKLFGDIILVLKLPNKNKTFAIKFKK